MAEGKTNLSQSPTVADLPVTPASDPVIEETWYQTMAGVMGNVLEWYDFALFGFFSGM